MMGFVNGLAIVIFISQLGMFKISEQGGQVWMQGYTLWTMIGLVALTMAIMFGLPKLTKKITRSTDCYPTGFNLSYFWEFGSGYGW
jgi:SulP family sulfate permease